MKHDFKQIEKKWQERWEKEGAFVAKDNSDKPKFYGLVEFPYPSGAGMHVGHIKAYSGLEVISRKRRMQGYNVLFPIGFDAFGLPTENYAIKTGVHPRVATDRNIEKFTCLNDAAEFIQKTKDMETRFMANARRMSRAFRLCNGSNDFTNAELDKIHYYMAIRSLLFKLTKGTAPDISQMNKRVQELIQGAIKSNEVEELFSETKDFNTGAIDLFDPKYIEKINKIKLPNTRVKILQKLLCHAIEEFKKVNKIKAMTFSERVKNIVDVYNSRVFDEIELRAIIDDTAEKLLELMEELTAEKSSFEALGINYEEKAFYDVLIAVEEKYQFEYPEEKNLELAKEIHKLVTTNTQYSDWANRKDIKARMQVAIILLLTKYGFPAVPKGTMPPEDYEKVYNDVIEQTENFKKYYNT